MAEQNNPAEDGGRPKKSKKKLVIVAAALLLLAGGGYAAKTFLFAGDAAEAAEKGKEPVETGPVIEVAQMTSSLAGPEPHYARVGIAAVLAPTASEEAVSGKFALIKDAAITEITKSSVGALRTPEGVEDLRRRLSKRAREIYPDGEVLRLVLTEFVVQ